MTNDKTNAPSNPASNDAKLAARAVAKLARIRADLRGRVLDQPEMIDALLVAFVSGEHVAIIGPQGEAKTLAATLAAEYFPGATFSRLLSRFSTPDELLGHFSIAELQKDRYVRRMDGKAPDCPTVILDEVFKANSPCLNALLGLLNEGVVDGVKAKTKTAVGLSNEYPRGIASLERSGDDESLLPLWDRFGLRLEISRPTSDKTLRRIMVGDLGAKNADSLDEAEFDALRELASDMWRNLPESIIDAILDIANQLDDEGVKVSSRRLRKAARIVAAFAVVSGRFKAKAGDLKILQHVLWNSPDEKSKVADIVLDAGDPEIVAALAVEAEVTKAHEEYKAAGANERPYLREELARRVKSEVGALEEKMKELGDGDADEVSRIIAQLKTIHVALRRDAMEALNL